MSSRSYAHFLTIDDISQKAKNGPPRVSGSVASIGNENTASEKRTLYLSRICVPICAPKLYVPSPRANSVHFVDPV